MQGESGPVPGAMPVTDVLENDVSSRPGPFQAVFAGRDNGVSLGPRWLGLVQKTHVALQPIVSIHSGRCVGYEAFLRGHEDLGFATVRDFLDAAHGDGVLPEVEAAIHARAVALFAGVTGRDDLKLFLNIDGRSLPEAAHLRSRLEALVRGAGLDMAAVVLEVSEGQPVHATQAALEGLAELKTVAGKIAIDGFGTGFSALPLLYYAEPDYVKINRFLIAGIARDTRKKLFLRQMVNMSHLLGIQVIATEVETEKEYLVCKDVGCDLAQGFFIQRPSADPADIRCDCATVKALNARDRRRPSSDQKLIEAQIDHIPPIFADADLGQVFERFRNEQDATFLPVINAQREPLGIVREQDLKAYVYSPFGKDLLRNKCYGRQMSDFLWRCPVADINTRAETILEIFSAEENPEGLLIADDGRYAGFLSARSLLRILNDKNLAMARDQNPLTKLPGNNVINGYLADALDDREGSHVITYLDFDNFKPFNDTYGFRQGDRAIMLFAEILNKRLKRDNCFIGHVGGDDFFAAFRNIALTEAETMVRAVLDQFRADVESFYDEADRAAGHIVAKDRDGVERHIPLLTASAALVEVPAGHALESLDALSALMADGKKAAKRSPVKMSTVSLASA